MIQPRTTWALRVARTLLCLIAVLCLPCGVYASAADPLDCVIEPHLVADLSTPEIGVLGSVLVDEADVVKAGDVLAALHDDVERAALKLSRARAAANAEVELLKYDHEFNTRKRNRIDQLQDQLAISAQSADEVRTAEELARLRLRAATEKQRTVQLEASRDALALERRTVRSPFNGVVSKRYKSAGEFVDGDPIVQLVQLDPLRVQVIAPIEIFGQISVGMGATVVPELPIDGSFEASVVSVDPVMDAATATFGVRLSLPNPEHRLPPGLKCTVVLHEPTAPTPNVTAQDVTSLVPVTPSLDAAPSLDAEPSQTASRTATVAKHEDAGLPADQCATLGPFRSDLEADSIAAELSASDIGSERRYTGRGSVGKGWLVLSSVVDATPASLLERIRQANITDSQLLTRGPWKNRISFGVYRVRQTALDRLHEIEELGFDAELSKRGNAKPAIWLDLTRHPTDPLLKSLVSTERDDGPALALQPIPCNHLASR